MADNNIMANNNIMTDNSWGFYCEIETGVVFDTPYLFDKHLFDKQFNNNLLNKFEDQFEDQPIHPGRNCEYKLIYDEEEEQPQKYKLPIHPGRNCEYKLIYDEEEEQEQPQKYKLPNKYDVYAIVAMTLFIFII